MVVVRLKERKYKEVDGVKKLEDVFVDKKFDSVNFISDNFSPSFDNIAAKGVDYRTGKSVVITKDVSYYEILANYGTYISNNEAIHKEKIVDGKMVKTYGYLDLGLVPVFMPPIGLIAGIEELVKEYTQYMTSFGVKYYVVTPMNPFTGAQIKSASVKDIWAKRSDISKLLKRDDELFRIYDFHIIIGVAIGKIAKPQVEDQEPISF